MHIEFWWKALLGIQPPRKLREDERIVLKHVLEKGTEKMSTALDQLRIISSSGHCY
jgi:hypothetical protein